ncbi:unnamed protein product [Malassezia sympodialis ATCC 42132]|uniref:Uncharacterized protein n=1 Tax=Malassezia sympodialis (strain ATCC 42132) TaxID=1230383 RepID=M5EB54_MALS4|nr:uncharacterized protein MSY001_2310 [Malassezia sympodialis ATCC 42132]CCU99604.1 unnamed protein product [Malassezia sympodialis ATCC 42132]SHO76937.1 Uncharacterized protein MSYG_1276 [Malassezia sympodialis ATCC 42132]|eukprot:XP_018740844.1 uncharacterized protein MSY001_2310 [Malassezia sympodialis ATCC 42132]
MARRKSGLVDEGSDSDDSIPSDAEVSRHHAPSFVPGGRSAFPMFVSASQHTETPMDEDDDEATQASTTEPAPTWARRTPGAGLGAPFAVEEDELDAAPRVGLGRGTAHKDTDGRAPVGAAPVPASAGPALSRTSGSGAFDPAAYMRQMGWTGGGLGKEGEGIVNPIEVQIRPNRAGVAFGGRREKSKQARVEERRRQGLPPDSDDEASTPTSAAPPVEKVWKKARKVRKPTVVYRTYDEIVAEVRPDVEDGPILDATGEPIAGISSVAEALQRHPVPTSESAQLPELRHNLALLTRGLNESLNKLAHHGAGLRDRARWLQRDQEASTLRAQQSREDRARVASTVDAVRALSAAATKARSLADLQGPALRVMEVERAHMAQWRLDEAMAGALVPVLRRDLASWEPLAEPLRFVTELAAWASVLRPTDSGTAERPMTPYESVLWNLWMPRVRHALTNAWSAHDPAPAIALVEAWRDVLPAFVLDNVFEQLLIPKLHKAVQAWTPKQGVALHTFVLPWLPVSEARLVPILGDTRRQWRHALSSWRVADRVPRELLAWQGVYTTKEWDALLLDRIVPALARALRTQFRIDPSAQSMEVLEHVLAWQGVLRDSVLSRLLETELGTPWLHVLHQWITQASTNLAEIAAWYEFWRTWLPPAVARLDGVSHMFQRALQHMNAALDRGADRIHLPPPSTAPLKRADAAAAPPRTARHPPPTLEDVTFRHVLEEVATAHDLFVRPLNQLEATTGLALLRMSLHVDGKQGTTFYVDDDVVFVADDTGAERTYEPISVGELVHRARAET